MLERLPIARFAAASHNHAAATLPSLAKLLGQFGILRLQLAHVLHGHFEAASQVVHILTACAFAASLLGLFFRLGEPLLQLLVFLAQLGEIGRAGLAGAGLSSRFKLLFQVLAYALRLGDLAGQLATQLIELLIE